ncbi:6441_t:CDS:2, partial [Funneliformis mosseae]
MEEQKEKASFERILSSDEFNSNQLENNKDNQASDSETNILLGSSSVWLYFNKNPADVFSYNDMLLLFESLERATRYLSASSYPTMGDTRLVFTGIQTHLDKYANDNNFIASEVAALISSKIKNIESKPSACAQIQSIFELYKEQSYSSTNLVLSTP